MEYDWSNNDLLGEQDACDFLGVQKGVPVNVTNAAALANTRSAPARLGKRQMYIDWSLNSLLLCRFRLQSPVSWPSDEHAAPRWPPDAV